MSYTLKTNLANKSNYGKARNVSTIKYIVIHMTANDGDKATSNGTYFHNNSVGASAHYFVDDTTVVQSVPDNYIAYAVGGKKYSDCAKTGGGKLYQVCTNANSISIELCDTVKNGVIYPTSATITNAIILTQTLMKKYNIPISRVVRHFDVNGKHCPSYWMTDSKFQTEFLNKIGSQGSNSSQIGYVVGKTYTLLYDSYIWSKADTTSPIVNLEKYASLPNVNGNTLIKGSKIEAVAVEQNGANIWVKCPLGYIPAYYNGKVMIQ